MAIIRSRQDQLRSRKRPQIDLRVAAICCVWLASVPLPGGELHYQFAGAEPLPDVTINGRAARVHSQGLLVTATHYWVTGRLESDPPRPLLLRFPRLARDQVEILELTPAPTDVPAQALGLDHPGGFDRDDKGDLYIPVSTSHRRGPTLVYRLSAKGTRALSQLRPSLAFSVADHIGAIAWDARQGELVGANWDTLDVYRWTRAGQLVAKRPRGTFLSGMPEWQLAVQDWKGIRPGVLLAGGIDKSDTRAPGDPQAVVQQIDLAAGTVLASQRLAARDDVRRPVTNEGLCLFDGILYLLPEDLGANAKVLKYAAAGRP